MSDMRSRLDAVEYCVTVGCSCGRRPEAISHVSPVRLACECGQSWVLTAGRDDRGRRTWDVTAVEAPPDGA